MWASDQTALATRSVFQVGLFCIVTACSSNPSARPPAEPKADDEGAKKATRGPVRVHVENTTDCHDFEIPHHGPLGADAVQVDVHAHDVIVEIWNASSACPEPPIFTASYKKGRLLVERSNRASLTDQHREIALRISGVPKGRVEVQWRRPAAEATASYEVHVP